MELRRRRTMPPEKQKLVLVDVSHIGEQEVYDNAEKTLQEDRDALRGFSGFFKRVWKHNLFREVYRQSAIASERDVVFGSRANSEADTQALRQNMGAIIDRFSQEYQETVHEGVGEQREQVDLADGTEKNEMFKRGVDDLIHQYAVSDMSEEAFREAKNRLIHEWASSSTHARMGRLYADNMLEIARNARACVAHGAGVDAVSIDDSMIHGVAKHDIRTESQFTWTDKAIEALAKTKVGGLVNETTLATAVGIATSVGAAVSERAARSKAFAWGSLGATAVVSSALAGLREHHIVTRDRKVHARERAMGERIEGDKEKPRRREMERFLYETVSAKNMSSTLERYTGLAQERALTRDEWRELCGEWSRLNALITFSDEQGIDLLDYSSPESVAQERLHLDIVRAQAKKALASRRYTAYNPVPLSGISPTEESRLKGYLDLLRDAHLQAITKGEQGTEEKDRQFSKWRTNQTLKASVKGLVSGLAIGGVLQEVGSWFRGDQRGVVEGSLNTQSGQSARHVTALEHLRSWVFGTERAPQGTLEETSIAGHTVVTPTTVEVLPGTHGQFSVVARGETIVETATLDLNGHLDNTSVQQLQRAGFLVSEESIRIPGAGLPEVHVVSAGDFVKHHEGAMETVRRAVWYDNDTPAPIFDQNELKFVPAGVHGSGVDVAGNYAFHVKGMAPEGSFHASSAANAPKLAHEGSLRILLSASRDTQNLAFSVPIHADGSVVVNPSSPEGSLFRVDSNNHVSFSGGFMEIAHTIKQTAAGEAAVGVLATVPGENTGSFTEFLPTDASHIRTVISPDGKYTIDPPPFFPILGRFPLEPTENSGGLERPIKKGGIDEEERREQKVVPIVGVAHDDPPLPARMRERTHVADVGLYGLYSLYGSNGARGEERYSDTVKNNPDAILNEKEEVHSYFEREYKQDFIGRERVQALVAQMQPMEKTCKISVCIPVAGHQEERSIFATLEHYTKQTLSRDAFEIVLFVNQPDKDLDGNRIEADGTLKEVRRFQNAFPDVRVRVASAILPRSEAKIGHIRKLLSDAVLVRRMRQEGARNDDYILVSNDADIKGLASEYLGNFLHVFSEQPQVDSLLGQLDWDHDAYRRNPHIHVATRLFQYMGIQTRRYGWHIESSGANFAYRAAAYAAVGGYDARAGGGEDSDFGAALKHLRCGAKQKMATAFAGARVSRLITSARRAEQVWQKGLAPVEQWDKGFSAFDDEVRKTEWEKQGGDWDLKTSEGRRAFVVKMEYAVNRTLRRVGEWNVTSSHPFFVRSMGWLGIRFEPVDDHTIRITDAESLLRGLTEYQNKGKE